MLSALAPMVESMSSSPDFISNLISAYPGMKEMMEKNPEYAGLFRNPDIMRLMGNAMSNPSLFKVIIFFLCFM
jgi:hypothetical protein